MAALVRGEDGGTAGHRLRRDQPEDPELELIEHEIDGPVVAGEQGLGHRLQPGDPRLDPKAAAELPAARDLLPPSGDQQRGVHPAGQRAGKPMQQLVVALQPPILAGRRQQQRLGGVLVLQMAPQGRLLGRKEDGFVDRMGTEGIVPDAGALGGVAVVGIGDDDMVRQPVGQPKQPCGGRRA